MKTTHTFQVEQGPDGKKLIETRTGDELYDQKQQRVEGSFVNNTYYPEVTARNMIKELERQMADSKLAIEARNKQIKKMMGDASERVDKVFMRKLKSAMAQLQIDRQKEGNKNEEKKIGELQKQLDSIKAVWPELF